MSIWYDQLEQMKKDYSDMKEVYDKLNISQKTAEQLENSKVKHSK